MHELGICDALLKLVDGVAKDEGLECVKKVTVEVGTLSGVIPAYLADCWTAVTDGTAYQDTRFVVETLPGTARCLDCGAEFIAEKYRHLIGQENVLVVNVAPDIHSRQEPEDIACLNEAAELLGIARKAE